MIEDKAHIRLSATDNITSWMIRRSTLANTFLLERTAKHHSRDDITKITRANFYHSDQLLMRKSETRKPNAANPIPNSFQVFGLEEPQRAMSTLSEQHKVFTQQGRFERRMFKKSGTVAHKEYERYTVGTTWRGQSSGSSDA